MSVKTNVNLTCRGWRARKRLAIVLMVALVASTPGGPIFVTPVSAQAPAPFVGAGFVLNAGDLRFIKAQIDIAEAHARGGDLLQLIPEVRVPFGLRTVNGSFNHLVPGQTTYGAADQIFPRMITPPLFRDAEPLDPDGPGPAPTAATSYTQKKGIVGDSHPRVVSNLIVDQTASNPAAVAAAGPDAITEVSGTLFTPNTATDAGLSAPFNSMFTFFGQFFDHGLDLVTKGGGFVFIPLKDDDPLVVAGPDRIPGNGDEVPPGQRFMIFTRATNQPGPDGKVGDDPATVGVDESADDIQEATNTTTPFVDQNQTYTSHPSHQVFLREYTMVGGRPVATGRLIDGFQGAIGTWAEVKAQALTMLGIQLTDRDIFNVPELVTDDYGRFIRGANGYPLMRMADGSAAVEGSPATPITTEGAMLTGHAFLDDIAHNAVPGVFDDDNNPATPPVPMTPDLGSTVDPIDSPRPFGTYDDDLLGRHYVTGDGRGNENIALTSVHTIFHSEHNRLAGVISGMIGTPASPGGVLTPDEVQAWWADNSGESPQGWNFGERLFQAAKFVTEMQYQHLVFEEFARKVQPNINPFIGDGINFVSDLNPAITAEFAHTVYRFGHSMLRDMVARTNPDGSENDIPLLDAFLNPLEFNDNNSLSAAEAAGRIFQGGVRQVGNEIDEFITEVLRSNLL
ncbi:MAG: heme peroxidase, partial [Acidobacteria bacterium]